MGLMPETLIGFISTAKGIANNTFAILEPTTFPIAIPGYPPSEALIDIANSGAEVPKATMVRAITKTGILSTPDKETAPFTKNSPAKKRKVIPRITRNSAVNVDPIVFV